uniref:Uncharacterized protein n=1 Tax=Timema shepardi TaxID=629360 RepID=A0A7R9B1A6_TIMSH|nr:unnamed protein product [Timema shepardi]
MARSVRIHGYQRHEKTASVLSATIRTDLHLVTLLNKLSLVAPQRIQPRLSQYTQAYQLGTKEGRTCDQLYQCDKPNLSISKGSIIYNLL